MVYHFLKMRVSALRVCRDDGTRVMDTACSLEKLTAVDYGLFIHPAMN